MHYSIWSNFKFEYGVLWKHKKRILLSTIAEACFAVAIPIAGTAITSMIVSLLEQETERGALIGFIFLIFMGYGILNMGNSFFKGRGRLQYIEARTELFISRFIKKIMEISLEQYEEEKTHSLQEKADKAVWANTIGVEGFYHDNSELLRNVLGLVVYSLIVGAMNPLILGMLILLAAITAASSYLATGYYQKIKDKLAKEAMTTSYINRVVDDVPGGKDIRIFGLRKWIIEKYDRAICNIRKIQFRYDCVQYGSAVVDTVLSSVRNLICYLYLIDRLAQGMGIGEFVFYLGLVNGFSTWLNAITKSVMNAKRDSDIIGDLRSYLDLEDTIQEEGKVACQDWKSDDVVFDQVSYCYEGAKEPVIKDLSFHIKAGSRLALVGLNGAGKSTLVKLISGLYLPTSGKIYINGVDSRELNRRQYFTLQAAIFQETFTTAFSIAENVAFEENYDEDKVWDVLEQAGLKEKIMALPRKIQTPIGKDIEEDGIQLSGGETQKLLLARALYREARLILLDEPTAALDACAETAIYQSYEKVLKDKTVLFISHRLASTRFCDEILLLQKGKLLECGTHEELMSRKGYYYDLFQVQSKYYQEGGAVNG